MASSVQVPLEDHIVARLTPRPHVRANSCLFSSPFNVVTEAMIQAHLQAHPRSRAVDIAQALRVPWAKAAINSYLYASTRVVCEYSALPPRWSVKSTTMEELPPPYTVTQAPPAASPQSSPPITFSIAGVGEFKLVPHTPSTRIKSLLHTIATTMPPPEAARGYTLHSTSADVRKQARDLGWQLV